MKDSKKSENRRKSGSEASRRVRAHSSRSKKNLSSVIAIAVFFILALSTLVSLFIFSGDPVENTPQDAVRTFIDDLNSEELDVAFQSTDLHFITNKTIISRAKESFGDSSIMSVQIQVTKRMEDLNEAKRSMLEDMGREYKDKFGINVKEFAIVWGVLREEGSSNSTPMEFYCVQIEDRWYIAFAHLFWDDDYGSVAPILYELQFSTPESNSTHWSVSIESGSVDFYNITSWVLEKDDAVVAGYFFNKDNLARQTGGNPEQAMVWYDINDNWIMDYEDMAVIQKPYDVSGEYLLIIRTDRIVGSVVLNA